MFEGASVGDIWNLCQLSCRPNKNMIVTEVERNKFVLTNVQQDMLLQGAEKSWALTSDVFSSKVGAVSVDLPCGYSLLVENREIIGAEFPCHFEGPKKVAVKHLIPAIWTNITALAVDAFVSEAELPSGGLSMLNGNWTRLPQLNFSQLDEMTFGEMTPLGPSGDAWEDLHRIIRWFAAPYPISLALLLWIVIRNFWLVWGLAPFHYRV
jgi:hypothetical protein